MGHKGLGYAGLSFGCSNLPFTDACQLLDLRHNLGYFKLQSLKEECEKAKHFFFPTLDSAHSCNAVLMKNSCTYTYNFHLYARAHTPQYHREALSSCVGCLTAHPSLPGTDPRELKDMM